MQCSAWRLCVCVSGWRVCVGVGEGRGGEGEGPPRGVPAQPQDELCITGRRMCREAAVTGH